MNNKKVMVAILAGFLALVLTLGLVAGVLPQFVEAASLSELQKQLDDLKNQKTEIENQITGLKEQMSENLDSMQAIVARKNAIDQEVFMLHEQISNLNSQISTYVLLIADKQEELEAANARLTELNIKNKQRIRAMEEDGSISYWSVLFKSSSFADLLDRLDMVEEIAAADQRRLQDMSNASKAVEEAKNVLETEKGDLEDSKAELAKTEMELEDRRAEADELLELLIATGEEYERLLEEAEDEISSLTGEISNAQDAYKEAEYRQWLSTSKPANNSNAVMGKPSGSTTTNGITWLTPCVYRKVTSKYGYRTHPVTGEKQKFHYGIDLAASQGTPVIACRTGKVTTSTYNSSAGNYLVVDHGDGFKTKYLHLTHYIVKKGDYVTAGQVIGYVGSTGASTGPHLHFGMMLNGVHVNPAHYIDF